MAKKNSVATNNYTVSDEIAAMQTLGSVGLNVHPQRCVRLRNRHASCNRCAQACTSGAIDIKDNTWNLDPSLCVKCGTCATVCPTSALEASYPHDADLLHSAVNGASRAQGVACFACSNAINNSKKAIDISKVVQIVCLSRLDETMIFMLLQKGAKEIYAVHGQCEQCERSQGCVSAQLVENTVASVAKAWGIEANYHRVNAFPGEVIATDECVSEGENSSYEQFSDYCLLSDSELLEVSDEGHLQASIKPVHVQKDGTLPHFVPARRRKLLDTLAHFGNPVQELIDTRLWGHVIIDFSRCKSCKMCAVFCPTGALSKYSDSNGAGIEHYVAECVHCCLCQDICPQQAITCVTQVPAMQLAQGETEKYCMPDPDWMAGPDQILQRMKVKISGNSVEHSY